MILIGIKSCWKHKDRRQACRDTWLSTLPYQYHFVVGRHAPARPFGSLTDSLYGEPDVISDNVSDDFKNIGPKVVRMAQQACNALASHLVVMDDDTYLCGERLGELIGRHDTNNADVTAFMRSDPWYPQGAMYIMGPRAFRVIAAHPIMQTIFVPDDVLVGRALIDFQEQAIAPLIAYHTDDINPGPDWRTRHPLRSNTVVSTHKCLPADMRLAHAEWEKSVASV